MMVESVLYSAVSVGLSSPLSEIIFEICVCSSQLSECDVSISLKLSAGSFLMGEFSAIGVSIVCSGSVFTILVSGLMSISGTKSGSSTVVEVSRITGGVQG